jgi:hypothetical protein
VYFTTDQFPVQKDAWAALKTVPLTDPAAFYVNAHRAHVCAYTCLLRWV